MKNRILTAFALLSCCAAIAQKATATLDRNDILIGEQIRLRLTVNYTASETPAWFVIDTIPRFEILERSEVDTQRTDGTVVLSQNLTLTSWDSGKIQLPSFAIGRLQTNSLPVNVAYAPSPFDTTQPYHEIKDILEVKKPIEEKWYWYIIFALVVLALFLLFFPKGKKKTPGVFVPDESAFKKALRQLEQMKRSEVTDNRLFYTELVQVFRDYLHRRKNIYSYSKTTDDLGLQLQRLQMDRDQYAAVLQTLRLSDLVKFARYQPSAAENETSIDTIRDSILLIENTTHAV